MKQIQSIEETAKVQHQGRPLAELAPWMFAINDQTIVNKDSGLMACFEYKGVDTDGVPESYLENLSFALNNAMVTHQNAPLMQWWTLKRLKTDFYPCNEFTNPISQLIDEDRRQAFMAGQNYINKQYFSQVLHPSIGMGKIGERFSNAISKGESVWSAFMAAVKTYFDDQHSFAYTNQELDEAVARHEEILADFIGRIPSISFKRLTGANLGGFLHGLISPQSRDKLPKLGVNPIGNRLLDESIPEGYVTPHRDFIHHEGLDEKFTVAITVGEFDKEVALGALDRLLSVPGEITLTVALQFMSKSDSESLAESQRDYHRSKLASWKSVAKASLEKGGDLSNSPVNSGRAYLAEEASTFLARVTMGDISGIRFYCSVLCHGDTLEEADETASRVQAILRNAQIKPELEKLHLLSAFATSIPGNWKECARWEPFSSEAFSLIAPLHTIENGQLTNPFIAEQTHTTAHAMCVLPTDYNTPFYLSPHWFDLGHGFLCGPSRGGKTTLMSFLWSQFLRYHNAQVFILDKDLSSRIPVLLQGGAYQTFSSEGLRWNPLKILDESNFEWVMSWVELLCAQRGEYALDGPDSRDLEIALRSVMKLSLENRRLSTVMATCTSSRLKAALEPWTGGRALSKYFDNEEDGFDLSGSIVGVPLDDIIKHPQVSAPAMEYIFKRIDMHLQSQISTGVVKPTFIGIPEIWALARNEIARAKMEDWLKTLAKRCAVVWMDTQSLDDLLKSGFFASIRDCVPNRIFIPNPQATTELLANCYMKDFQLSYTQVERIQSGAQKRDYLVIQGDVSRWVRMNFTKEILPILRSDIDAQVIFNKHYMDGKAEPGWERRYLNEMAIGNVS